MKISKKLDEIRGKVWKIIQNILRKLKKNCSVLNIFTEISKKFKLYEKLHLFTNQQQQQKVVDIT